MYSFGMPPRSLTNTTVWPVFGFHVGEVLAPLAYVIRLGRLPLASITKSSGFPSIDEENMICEPSGDHAGALLEPRKLEKNALCRHPMEKMRIADWPRQLPKPSKETRCAKHQETTAG